MARIFNAHKLYDLLRFYPDTTKHLIQIVKTEQGYILWFTQINQKHIHWLLNLTETSILKRKIIEVHIGERTGSSINVVKMVREYDIYNNCTIRLVNVPAISIASDSSLFNQIPQ